MKKRNLIFPIIIVAIFMLTAVVGKVYRFALLYATLSAVVNIFAFTFSELPIMG